MDSRGASHGGATISGLDIVLGLNRPDPCPGTPHHSPLFTVLGGVGIVPISGSARLEFIGRILRVSQGMKKFGIRAGESFCREAWMAQVSISISTASIVSRVPSNLASPR